jgi:hypothetical protein
MLSGCAHPHASCLLIPPPGSWEPGAPYVDKGQGHRWFIQLNSYLCSFHFHNHFLLDIQVTGDPGGQPCRAQC